jgi:SAM-dependent methyltransferase
MHDFRVSNPATIKRLLDKNRDDIKEITIGVKDPDVFLSDMLVDLKDDIDWPYAVNPALIVNPDDEDELQLRAKSIVEMNVEQDVFGLNFLDFGCGEGHVSSEVLSRGARKVVAYDIKAGSKWPTFTQDGIAIYTTDWKQVIENAPYDYILIYDVLDHVMDKDPKDVLSELSKLLAKDGFISVRFHPWIGRHGSHLYTQLNKAFAHLIYDEEKLKRAGYDIVPTRKVIHPMWTYKNWIQKAGLSVVKEDKIQEPVEKFFMDNDVFKSVIQKHFKNSPMEEYKEGKGDLGRVMSFHFCDFILAR